MHGPMLRLPILFIMMFAMISSYPRTAPAAEPPVQLAARPFDLADVRLLESRFKQAADRHAAYLLSLEPDRLLAGFREQAGLAPRAPRYGGWESQGVAGHTLGHHLSACALAYRSTGDQRFRQRVDYIVQELAECQAAHGDGYVAAIPDGRRIFEEVSRGEIRSSGFDLNGGWVPWYTMHKLFAGLRDAYQLCYNEQAREVLIALGEWALATTDRLTDDQLQQMLAAEFGGMNESAADLYALTGDLRFLVLADRFSHRAVFEPLARGEDRLHGLHANTQIPKIIGAARQYELTGDDYFRDVAAFFWHTVIENHTYVIGGNSDAEHFGPPGVLASRLSDQTAETCNTYNMLKLTRHLFTWTTDASFADFYERALVNHILGSQHPETAAVSYFVPLRHGARRQAEGLYDRFSCCVGTGQENHVKYADSIYFHSHDALWVNLYMASELRWRDKAVKLRMESSFPDEGPVKISLEAEAPVHFVLKLRRPAWAEQFVVKVNGEGQEVTSPPGSYIDLNRQWRAGDRVEILAPYALHLHRQPDRAHQVALLSGPLVLAAEIGDPDAPRVALVSDDPDLLESIEPQDAPGRFRTAELGRPHDLDLLPFFQAWGQPHAVYLDTFTTAEWEQHQAEYRAEQQRQRELAERTVDAIALGQMQPERDHALEGERTRVGAHLHRTWRDALPGGWFEFDLEVDPHHRNQLLCTYWGGEEVPREFHILIDGERIATQRLHMDRPGEFFEVVYSIPRELTQRRERVRVRFEGSGDSIAGGCFGARMLRE
jgi:uncharacterized protein